MQFDDILENLEQLTPHQLWRIYFAANHLMDDESRLKPIRAMLTPGMKVSYFNPNENRYIQAVVIEAKRTLVICDD